MAFICKHSNKECNGCRECSGGHVPAEPSCPECGSTSCDYFYWKNGEFIGCDDCIRKEDVYGME